ncbi:MAG: sugar phosphate isomerase/epimerase [Bacteroidetes bacterium]|nr:sugar phosphate isomerase/epimerase [Bacteroidota bacterium]
MKIKYLCTMWGMNKPSIEENLNLIKDAGFDGVEMKAPAGTDESNRLCRLLKERRLDLVAQVRAEGSTLDEQTVSIKNELVKAARLNPLLINAHCGKDYWTFDKNLKIIVSAQTFAKELKLKIVHETHRARATFCTTSTMEIIDALPEIRFTADFAHWCCVHNTLLHDQPDPVDRVIERADYIHARVGNATSPQITDPRTPENKDAVKAHLNWWEKIVTNHRNSGSEFLPICSEFGPPDYMVTLPFTDKPIANQWELNCYMKDMLKEQFEG